MTNVEGNTPQAVIYIFSRDRENQKEFRIEISSFSSSYCESHALYIYSLVTLFEALGTRSLVTVDRTCLSGTFQVRCATSSQVCDALTLGTRLDVLVGPPLRALQLNKDSHLSSLSIHIAHGVPQGSPENRNSKHRRAALASPSPPPRT